METKNEQQQKSNEPRVRKLKIQPLIRLNGKSSKTVPVITLCGNWLEACGFDCGKNVIIEVAMGIITLKVDNN